MKPRFLTFAMLAVTLMMASSSTAQSGNKVATPVTCDIVGTVNRMKLVQRSPWSDGTPSTMTTLETHLYVAVDNRTPHDKADADATTPCHSSGKIEMRTYKLCSPTQVKQGDRIHGTEGSQTGSASIVGCLFDLVVLPKNQ